jgi:soluble lytic murein transglycosylase-like protein
MKHRFSSVLFLCFSLGLGACATTDSNVSTYAPEAKTSKASQQKKLESMTRRIAKKHGVPADLAVAVVTIESRWNHKARGRAGEVGLMQIKPQTARGIGYKGSVKALYNPETNLTWGMKYLAEAHRRADGNLCGTILRYNAGIYAKRMNPISARYCGKVKRMLARA